VKGWGGVDDFYVPDEPVEDVLAAYDSGDKGVMWPPSSAGVTLNPTPSRLLPVLRTDFNTPDDNELIARPGLWYLAVGDRWCSAMLTGYKSRRTC
jgi:hypothetical protein